MNKQKENNSAQKVNLDYVRFNFQFIIILEEKLGWTLGQKKEFVMNNWALTKKKDKSPSLFFSYFD